MPDTRAVLFIQGGGQGTHDEWDARLVESLRRELGDGYSVQYPRMPVEEDPSSAAWGPAILRELAGLEAGAVVVGHSVGATLLVQALVEGPPTTGLTGIVLLAAPFVGTGGWAADGFELPATLGARLPPGVPVHVFHGLEDETVPPAHADLYGRAIPQARMHLLPGRDHQLGGDLAAVATVIRAMQPARPALHPMADASQPAHAVPVLTGPRVTLRVGRPDDATSLRRVFDAPEVARWWPTPDDDELGALLENRDPDVDVWLVEVDGRIVGLIQGYEEADPMYRHAGIDIVLHPDAHGRGLGAEAIRVLARHLFDDRGHHRLVIDPNASNARAIHVYGKVGFRRVGVLRDYEWDAHEGRWTDGLLMDMLRGELADG